MDAQDIASKLTREGYDIDALHGDLSQPQRDKVMQAFRDKTLQLLIATDVAARGIDVKEITHVINYELPDDTEVYTPVSYTHLDVYKRQPDPLLQSFY